MKRGEEERRKEDRKRGEEDKRAGAHFVMLIKPCTRISEEEKGEGVGAGGDGDGVRE